MKRIIAVIIAAALLFTVSCGICDDDASAIPFSCSLTSDLVPDTAIEILASDSQRALLTICLLLDLGIGGAEDEYLSQYFGTFLVNDSYVASDGTFLVVTGHAGGKVLNLYYDPAGKQASYFLMDSDLPDSLMDTLVKTTAESLTFNYKNNPDSLMEVMMIFKDALSDN